MNNELFFQNRVISFQPVDKAVVSADDIATKIETIRNQLAGGGSLQVNSNGTILNPNDPMTLQDSTTGGVFKPVPKAEVAAQWYENDHDLYADEIRAMLADKPDAKGGKLPNGKMYWSIRLFPVICGKRKDWTLLMVYDEDHPQVRWGGSVKVYPVKPNIDEMHKMVNESHVTPKRINHLIQDRDGQLYMCTQHYKNIKDGVQLVTSAATCLRFAQRWINVFELGLIDQVTWTKFQHDGEI